ncbi:MAG: glycosyltransferase family 2 protein [Synergistaceae bacterium]|nr:glycosyltransferase family 2 protein [Synergistaceae bacterium]
MCVPSYNRDVELTRLLESIDASGDNVKDIEIVIREDFSPRRQDIAKAVADFKSRSPYSVNYIENEKNFGYDKNLRSVAKSAEGEWVIFMGDDDVFIPGALDNFIKFLRENKDIGYVMRRYRRAHEVESGYEYEEFRYAKHDVFFEPSTATIIELFRRSLFISGFTFKKEYFDDYDCADYDGTLLFQLYILANICSVHKSCYCDIAITQAFDNATPFFGSSEAEKNLYDSGENSVRNSLNFMKQVKVLAESIEKKLNIKMTEEIITTYSKYSYGFLYEHRDDGIKIFREYARELRKLGFAKTYHFYIHYLALLLLGKSNFQNLIMKIKKLCGSTPKL